MAMVAGSKPAMSPAVSVVMEPPGCGCTPLAAVVGEATTLPMPPTTGRELTRLVCALGAAVDAFAVVTGAADDFFTVVAELAATDVVVSPATAVVSTAPAAPATAVVVVVAAGTPA